VNAAAKLGHGHNANAHTRLGQTTGAAQNDVAQQKNCRRDWLQPRFERPVSIFLTAARFESASMAPRETSAMSARHLWSDSDGVILPYVAITLVVIIGLSALAIDGSRLMSVQTQLQNGADTLAPAGAAELDRRPDSIIRARAAIQGLVINPISGAEIGQIAEVTSIDFLQSLPASDDLPIAIAN